MKEKWALVLLLLISTASLPFLRLSADEGLKFKPVYDGEVIAGNNLTLYIQVSNPTNETAVISEICVVSENKTALWISPGELLKTTVEPGGISTIAVYHAYTSEKARGTVKISINVYYALGEVKKLYSTEVSFLILERNALSFGLRIAYLQMKVSNLTKKLGILDSIKANLSFFGVKPSTLESSMWRIRDCLVTVNQSIQEMKSLLKEGSYDELSSKLNESERRMTSCENLYTSALMKAQRELSNAEAQAKEMAESSTLEVRNIMYKVWKDFYELKKRARNYISYKEVNKTLEEISADLSKAANLSNVNEEALKSGRYMDSLRITEEMRKLLSNATKKVGSCYHEIRRIEEKTRSEELLRNARDAVDRCRCYLSMLGVQLGSRAKERVEDMNRTLKELDYKLNVSAELIKSGDYDKARNISLEVYREAANLLSEMVYMKYSTGALGQQSNATGKMISGHGSALVLVMTFLALFAVVASGLVMALRKTGS